MAACGVDEIGLAAPGPVHYSDPMNGFLVADPHLPRFLALLLAFLLVVVWLRSQPEWLLVVLPVFAVTFLGFDRLADGVAGLVASGEIARLALGAVLMAGPAFAVGFALGRRAGRPALATATSPAPQEAATAPPYGTSSPTHDGHGTPFEGAAHRPYRQDE